MGLRTVSFCFCFQHDQLASCGSHHVMCCCPLQAFGTYEGNYWELMGDCEEMIDVLKWVHAQAHSHAPYTCSLCAYN